MDDRRQPIVRARAASKVGDSESAIRLLAKLLGDPSEVVRLGAVYGLVAAATPEAEALLERAAETDEDKDVRETARDELEILRNERREARLHPSGFMLVEGDRQGSSQGR